MLEYGTEHQKCALLPAIAAGETYFAIGMSEPDSGSDLASVRTRATHDGDGWRISGDDEVRAIVVTGAGSTFCPGVDAQRLESAVGAGMNLSGRVSLTTTAGYRKPIVAAINGACAGIGPVQARTFRRPRRPVHHRLRPPRTRGGVRPHLDPARGCSRPPA